jgi:hypothetical protein
LASRVTREDPEAVAQGGVGGIVVDEAAEVVEDAVIDAVEHVGRVAGDEGGAGIPKGSGRSSNMAHGSRGHVRSPVRGDDHDLGVEAAYGVEEPGRRPSPQIGVGDARAVRSCRVVGGMIGNADDADLRPESFENPRSPSADLVDAGAHAGNPGGLEVTQGVEERLRTEVQRVVVGQVTQSTPRRPRVSAATGGARKKNAFHGSGQG